MPKAKATPNSQPRVFQMVGNILDAGVTLTGMVNKQATNLDTCVDIIANAGIQSAQYVDVKARHALKEAEAANI